MVENSQEKTNSVVNELSVENSKNKFYRIVIFYSS